MADLTHGAVDSLLGVLSAAIKDEADLLSGVQGDIQFIRDEMDSMNGFLLHLTKSGDEHDDQQRAWMKQVRDIAYIAQDCIELYMRITPSHRGFWGYVRHMPVLVRTWWPRRRLANRLRELKVRVRDVGERRQRYGVTVPEAKKGSKPAAVHQGADEVSKARSAFLQALASIGMDAFLQALSASSSSIAMDGDDAGSEQRTTSPPITSLLPEDLRSDETLIDDLLKVVAALRQRQGDGNVTICMMEMLLRALHVSPQGQGRVSKEEVKNIIAAADLPRQVMVLCYSKLSRDFKSCLQYLATFHEEKSISRTSLVRRWAAERLLVKEDEKQSYEQAAEVCFSELLFRGFVYPVEHGAAGKVKSCRMRDHVKDFVDGISKSENFEGSRLPPHLDNQFRVRQMVAKQEKKLNKERAAASAAAASLNICGFSLPRKQQDGKSSSMAAAAGSKKLEKSIDKQLKHFRSLPEIYRLNVMDLGGCRGLKKRHLKSICKLQTLKYLSLRNTDVPVLPHQIQALQLLETLDVRQTKIDASCTKRINLRKLKHLLAGDISHSSDGSTPNSTVRMPTNISEMTDMEVLSCVQISRGDELSEVENLKKLRKLGVLLPGSGEDIKNLRQAISKMGGHLHSLSIWIDINTPCADDDSLHKKDNDGTFMPPENLESLSITGMGKSGLPSWVDEGLKRLSKITLCNTHLTSSKLETLSKLKGLLCLRLHQGSFTEDELTFKANGFVALKFLLLEGTTITKLTFEGNSGQLEKIVWSVPSDTSIVAAAVSANGMEHLAGLKEVELKGLREADSWPSVEEAIAKHPKHQAIKIKINCVSWKMVAITAAT